MAELPPPGRRFVIVPLHFGLLLSLALLKAVKHHELGPRTSPGLEDWASALFIACVLGAAERFGGPFAGASLALLSLTLMIALWLDALLFRIFTIELGPGGVRSVVVTVLYRELAELSLARRFLAEHPWFALAPLAAIAAHLPLLVEGRARLSAVALTSCYFAVAIARTPMTSRIGALVALAGLVSSALLELAGVPLAVDPLLALPISAGLVAIAAFAPPSLIRSFLFPRAYPIAPDHRVEEEHEHLLELAPAAPERSELFGRLRGADVILVTIESMGRHHLPRMPFFESLREAGLRSEAHFCVSPTTNNAHVALYASAYRESPERGLVRAFAREGYRTIYASPIRAAHYGLRGILDRAGFDHVLDHGAFRPHALDGGITSDWVLPEQAPERIFELTRRGAGPLLIHVQSVNTHVPYRVVDRERFARHDSNDDLGRFLNGLEEADFIVSELVERLIDRGVVSRPIIAITGDHGQAFGRLGYHSHGSAIVRDEIDVPLIIHHPDLPLRVVPWSSHFDVLPTLLDLVGIEHAEPCFGSPMLARERTPELFLWAGHPSRSTTSNYGLLLGDRKYMIDLVTEKCYESDWSDEERRELHGAEKTYWSSLLSKMLLRLGLR